MLTHANAIANARNALLLLPRGLRPTDVTVTAAPMFHIGGLGVHSLPFVYVGAKNVIVPTFDPPAFLAAMAEHRATLQFLVPAMWAALMRAARLRRPRPVLAGHGAVRRRADAAAADRVLQRAAACRSRRASA